MRKTSTSSYCTPRAMAAACALIIPVLGASATSLKAHPYWTQDVAAHTVLTDGLTGQPGLDEGWVRLFADSTQLPKTSYNLGEFSFWGLNSPFGAAPSRAPHHYEIIRDANIKGVRYNILWQALQQEGPDSTNFGNLGTDSDITQYREDGFSILGMVDYAPAWTNGLRGRTVPPNNPVENELVQLIGDEGQLSHNTVLSPSLPFYLTPDPVQTERFENQIIENNFQQGDQPRCTNNPILVGTQTVWVDENDGRGWVEWTQVDNLVYSPDGAEHYQIDRDGRVKFRYNAYFYNHGKTPAPGSRVKVSYDALRNVYELNNDYTLNTLDGTITRRIGDITGLVPVEDFNGPTLDSRWEWTDEPADWDVGQSTPGALRLVPTISTNHVIGNFLYQALDGEGDFTASLRITASPTGQTGIVVYQDENNWLRFAITRDSGRPYLVQMVNGQKTVKGSQGEYGFGVYAPCWVSVSRRGGQFSVFTSTNNPLAPDGGYQWVTQFSQDLSFPLKVGISATGTSAVLVDQFRIKVPSIPSDGKVRAFYNYLNPEPFTDFLRELVGHFKDRVRYWEVWNEPDQSWVWDAGQDIYALFLDEAARAIKETDPDAVILNGGYANLAAHNLARIYQTVGNDVFDYANWHPYNFSSVPPDALDWDTEGANKQGRDTMTAWGDSDKQVFFSELATSSGVQAAGGGLNDWKQAEYSTRLFLLSRRMGYPKAIQWFPSIDTAAVGQAEDMKVHEHAGLFYKNALVPKPVFWSYSNAARNRGILIDLGEYDASGALTSPLGRYNLSAVQLSLADRSQVKSVAVLTSLTNTDDSSRPPVVAARPIGQSGASAMRVGVATLSEDLKHEKWTVTAQSSSLFQVEAEESGPQGLAMLGLPFLSDNQTVSFIIPGSPNGYIAGDRFEFETFRGDGFQSAGSWTNSGESGPGMVTIPLDDMTARYVAIHLVKAPGVESVVLDEVQVLDENAANLALGKLYIVDGYQDYFSQSFPDMPLREAALLPDGSSVQLEGKVLYIKGDGFAYIQEPDRTSGMRIQGDVSTLTEDTIVSCSGIMATSSGGEKYLQMTTSTAAGQHQARSLASTNSGLKDAMLNGIFVRAYGRVQPASVTADSYVIRDGSDGPGLKVITTGPPEVSEGEYVVVEGAAGAGNERVVYQRRLVP